MYYILCTFALVVIFLPQVIFEWISPVQGSGIKMNGVKKKTNRT